MRASPAHEVVEWLDTQQTRDLFVTSVTETEIRAAPPRGHGSFARRGEATGLGGSGGTCIRPPLRVGCCPSTVLPRARTRRFSRRARQPVVLYPWLTDRSQLLPGRGGRRSSPEMSGTSRVRASNWSIRGRRRERHDGSIRPRQDRRAAEGRGLEPDRRVERRFRVHAPQRHPSGLRALRPPRSAHGGAGGQTGAHRSSHDSGAAWPVLVGKLLMCRFG